MKNAIVTGASSGIGYEISLKLIELGYKVYGIGRDFSKNKINNELFIEVELDLLDTQKTVDTIKNIRKENNIDLLVNNAGLSYFGLHEELNVKKIQEMIRVNLETPLLITNLLLRDLKKNAGTIINISSTTAKKSSTYACVYGATKAGLSHFANSLFDEARKTGLKVVSIHPDITKTDFYRNADFQEGEEEDTYINPVEVANLVAMILTQRQGICITEFTIKPQRHQVRRKKL